MKIGKKIRAIRLSAKLTMPELAEICSVTPQKIKNVEYGIQRACEDVLHPISRNYPQFAFWLISDMTDEKSGHIKPSEEFLKKANS
jgi:transcriptional regulator with XRE-family HTH domain